MTTQERPEQSELPPGSSLEENAGEGDPRLQLRLVLPRWPSCATVVRKEPFQNETAPCGGNVQPPKVRRRVLSTAQRMVQQKVLLNGATVGTVG